MKSIILLRDEAMDDYGRYKRERDIADLSYPFTTSIDYLCINDDVATHLKDRCTVFYNVRLFIKKEFVFRLYINWGIFSGSMK